MVQLRLRKNEKIAMLADVALFSRCSKTELARIASLSSEHQASAGDVLTRRGDRGSEFFVIVEGKATATRDGVVLAHLGPGSFFGELALLDRGPRTATVVADSDMRLLVLSTSEFCTLKSMVPSVSDKIIDELAARLRKTDEKLDPAPSLGKKVGPWSL
jgi:CRP/FNR family cyclic AMP-dependent transcriptional regulator